MKKSVFLILALAVCFAAIFALSACKPQPETPPASVAETIAQAHNTDAVTEGVVFGKISGGFYIADSSAAVYVSSDTAVNVGEKVKVQGKFRLVNDQPQMTNVTVTKTGEGTVSAATASSVAAISELPPSARENYARRFTVSGELSKEGGVYLLVSGEKTIAFFSGTDTAYLADWEGKKIQLTVVTHNYSSGRWNVCYTGNADGISLVPVDIDSIKEDIYAEIDALVPQEIYGAVILPVSYQSEPNVIITWSVTSGDALTIADNAVTVKDVSSDSAVTLRVTLTSGENSDYKDYNVTVKALKTLGVAEIETAQLAEGENFYVRGSVIAKGQNYSSSKIYSAVLTDGQSSFLRVDLSEEQLSGLSAGDAVKILGGYGRDTNGIPRMHDVISVEVETKASADYKADYASFASVSLSQDGDYNSARADIGGVKLYKITAPFMVTSSSTAAASNYVRFGGSAANARNGYTEPSPSTIFCLPVVSLDANGLESFIETYGVPVTGMGAAQFSGYTFYAFALYKVDNTWQFIMDKDGVEIDYAVVVKNELAPQIPEYVNANVSGTMSLPTSTSTASQITWSSEPAVINADGSYEAQIEDVAVTLTAAFTVDGKDYRCDFTVTLTSEELEYMTISEVLALRDGKIRALKGTVIGFGSVLSINGIEGGVQNGIYVSDGLNVMYIVNRGLSRVNADEDIDKLYTADNRVLQTGDILHIIGPVKTGNTIDADGCSIRVTAKDDVPQSDVIDWNAAPEYSFGSQKDLEDYFDGSTNLPFYKLLKFEISAANPMYLGKGSNTDNAIPLRFFFDDAEAISLAGIKVNGYIIGTKAATSELSAGDKWWKELNPVFNENPYSFSSTSKKYAYKGEFYAVCTGIAPGTSDYYYIDILSEGFALSAMTEADWIEYEISKTVTPVVNASEDGVMTLVSAVNHSGTAGGNNPTVGVSDITWEIDEAHTDVVNTVTGQFSAVTQDVTVTLTANYQYGGKTYALPFEVTLAAKEIDYITVSEALLMPDGNVEGVKGIVIGFGNNTAGAAGGYQMGIYISDGTGIMFITADSVPRAEAQENKDKVYAVGGRAIQLGDMLYMANAAKDNMRLRGGSVTKVTAEADLAETDKITWNVTVADANVMRSQKEFDAFFRSENKTFTLIKVVATAENPLYLGTNQTTSSKAESPIIRMYFGDIAAFNVLNNIKVGDPSYVVGTRARSSECNLGDGWWNAVNPVFTDAAGIDYFGSSSGRYAYKGEFYAICSAVASPAYFLDIFGYGFTLEGMDEADWIAYEIAKTVESTVNASVAGTIELPQNITHTGLASETQTGNNRTVSAEMVWSVDGSTLPTDVETGRYLYAYQAVTEDKEVTVKATYIIDGTTYEKEIVIILQAAAD